MIDLKALRDNPDRFRASQAARGDEESLVDAILDADARRRSSLTAFENLRAEQKAAAKEAGKKIGQLGRELKAAEAAEDAEAAGLLREQLSEAKSGGVLAERVRAAGAEADQVRDELNELLSRMANLVEDGVPAGGEGDYVVIREVGSPRDFTAEGFEPLDHLALGEYLHAIDTERGAKVSGSRFYYLTGLGARLELALLNMAVDQAIAYGFTPMITPTIVNPEVMRGTGFLGEHSDEVYYLNADDQYLVGTSEVALAGYHSDEILDLTDGPLRYAGWSACYRREAGSYGKDTRGIIRVHQFHKIEMFSYVPVEESEAEHRKLLAWEEEMLRKVELPYRVIDVAAGDLGTSAARKYDCEAWLPTQNRYLELTSTSNCTTFQARRLGIRERTAAGTTRPVATLNGTLATTRWIVAMLENHQLADGAVRVPMALRPYLSGIGVLAP